MTDTPVEYHRSRYDAPKKKGFMGVSIGVWIVVLIVVTLLFGVLLYFVDKSRFELKIPDYTDDSVQVDLIDPIPPPPPVTSATLPASDFGLGMRCSFRSSSSQYSIPKASRSGRPT